MKTYIVTVDKDIALQELAEAIEPVLHEKFGATFVRTEEGASE